MPKVIPVIGLVLSAALLASGVGCTRKSSGGRSGVPTPLGPPSISVRSDASGEIRVDWPLLPDVGVYNIYWSTTPGVDKASGTLISGVVPPLVHPGLTNGTTYYYVATSLTAPGESEISPEAFAMPLAPPVITSISWETSEVTLLWSPVPGAQSYNIYWSTTPGVTRAGGRQIPGASSPHTHTGLANGTTHYYVVTAANSVGGGAESGLSLEDSEMPLAAPTGVGALAGLADVRVTWNPVVGATAYNIYWSTSLGVTKATGTRIADVTSPYLHQGLATGTTYFYVVTAGNGTGESVESAQVSATPGSIPGEVDWIFVHDGAAGGGDDDEALGITVDGAGKILVTGYSNFGWMVVWRLEDTGVLDTTFNGQGWVTQRGSAGGVGPERGHDITVDASGRILVTGFGDSPQNGDDMIIWAFDGTGALDPSFGSGGIVTHDSAAGGSWDDQGNAIVVDGSGRILTTGYSNTVNGTDDDMVIWRYDSSGNPDMTFGGTGFVVQSNAAGGGRDDVGDDLILDGSGRILVGGWSYSSIAGYSMVIWRFEPSGDPDFGFGPGGMVVLNRSVGWNDREAVYGIGIDPSGRILATGHASVLSQSRWEMLLWALDPSGTLDASFGTGGVTSASGAAGGGTLDFGMALAIDGLGRTLVTGSSGSSGVDQDMAIWRHDSSGAPDLTFGTGGSVVHDSAAGGAWHDGGRDITLDAAGRILVAGVSSRGSSADNDMVVWRYKP